MATAGADTVSQRKKRKQQVADTKQPHHEIREKRGTFQKGPELPSAWVFAGRSGKRDDSQPTQKRSFGGPAQGGEKAFEKNAPEAKNKSASTLERAFEEIQARRPSIDSNDDPPDPSDFLPLEAWEIEGSGLSARG